MHVQESNASQCICGQSTGASVVAHLSGVPVDQCTFKTKYRQDGSRYVYKIDCYSTTCSKSRNWIAPQ
jgi:hypothetical protein